MVLRVGVANRETAETADLVVCMRLPDRSRFTDNLTSACTRCGHGIFFRPECPSLPRKICTVCAEAVIPTL